MTRERPILMNAPMVRAILEGRKTMTRRVVKLTNLTRHPDNDPWYKMKVWSWRLRNSMWTDHTWESLLSKCPYGQPGDRLWVRETALYWQNAEGPCSVAAYAADGYELEPGERWRPSIHMPRWASRITIEITAIRVERLQDISEEDAIREGVERFTSGYKNYADPNVVCRTARASFCTLWESINGIGSWAANPWVWVIADKRISI